MLRGENGSGEELRITSDQNPRIKQVVRLRKKKYRDREGLFLIEGTNSVVESLTMKWDAEYYIVSDSASMRGIRSSLVKKWPSRTFVVTERLFDRVSDAETGAGVMGVIKKPHWNTEILTDPDQADRNILILDRIQDPGNLGTMIRTAAAAGYCAVIALKGTADLFSVKTLRSTAGMVFHMPYFVAQNNEDLLKIVRSSGRRLVVTDPEKGIPYFDGNLNKGVALVIGNEGQGISHELMEKADLRVTIPMAPEVESLNAGISAAILMYETVRK